MVTES
jgi:hypothetical protein